MTLSIDPGRPARRPDMTGVPVGWYLDPDSPGARRYWDGRRWLAPTTTATGAAATARPSLPALSSHFRLLVPTVQALLAAAALVHAAAALAAYRAQGAASQALAERNAYTAMVARDASAQVLQTCMQSAILLVLTAFAFVTWLHQAHHNDRLDRDQVQQDSRWAVLGWVVPVLSFLRPLQVVLDVWHGATGPVKGSPRPAPRSVPLWWGAWLLSCVLTEVALIRSLHLGGPAGTAGSLRHAHGLYLLLSVDHASAAVAAFAAVLVVQQLSAAVRRAPVGGPRA